MEEIDILTIDSNIREFFSLEEKSLPSLENILLKLQANLKDPKISDRVRKNLTKSESDIQKKIEDIRYHKTFNFYLMETAPYIQEYKSILEKPIKISFMKSSKDNSNKEKDIIKKKYLELASKYKNINFEKNLNIKTVLKCNNCSKKEFIVIDEIIYICKECGNQQELMNYSASYKDIDRVNISTKYTYDRKIHFRDCIKQFQGKQNSTIDEQIYKDLEEQFRLHSLLVEDATTKKKKFSKITKKHVHMFLKETGHSKHYEDVILIHYNLTGKKPPNISHLEDKLLQKFDKLVALYDEKFKSDNEINRTNFVSTHVVLYQFLMNEKFPCKKEDFNMLKTIDRKSFHDGIMEQLFREMNWNFYHIF